MTDKLRALYRLLDYWPFALVAAWIAYDIYASYRLVDFLQREDDRMRAFVVASLPPVAKPFVWDPR